MYNTNIEFPITSVTQATLTRQALYMSILTSAFGSIGLLPIIFLFSWIGIYHHDEESLSILKAIVIGITFVFPSAVFLCCHLYRIGPDHSEETLHFKFFREKSAHVTITEEFLFHGLLRVKIKRISQAILQRRNIIRLEIRRPLNPLNVLLKINYVDFEFPSEKETSIFLTEINRFIRQGSQKSGVSCERPSKPHLRRE